jgi:1,4-alpha-glucan branching enzyme
VIRQTSTSDSSVKVTFAVPDDGRPTSVVGCFNGWNVDAHPLRRRTNGTRSVSVELPTGSTVRFRYAVLTEVGYVFIDDPDAHGFEPNGLGQTHSVLNIAGQA